MKRISRDEYDATLRIFNHVESLIGPYYGYKTLSQAMGFVSENRWIMFPVAGINSLREGATLPMPNVFVSFDDIVQDNGTGKVGGYTGVTYHNVEAMIAFRNFLQRRISRLLNILSNMNDFWTVEVLHKTQTDCPNSTPQYNTFRSFKPQSIKADDLRIAIKDSDNALLKKGDTCPQNGNPILWSVTVVSIVKPVTVDTFDTDIQKIFRTFMDLLLLGN